MDFTLSVEEAMLKESIDCFMLDYASRRPASLAAPHGRDPTIWRSVIELGWLPAGFSEDVGGFGLGAVAEILIHEGIGRGLMVEPVLAATLAARVIALAAPEGRCAALLAPLFSGDRLIILAHDEPEARGDVQLVEAHAVRDSQGFRLSGRKAMIDSAPGADQLLISARIDGADLALFLVEASHLAGRMRVCRTIDGRAAAEIDLDGAVFSASALLAVGPQVANAINVAHDHAIVAAAADALGAMESALAITAEYLKTRHQFGVPISSFQALQHKLADMVVAIEQARSIILCGVAALSSGDSAERARGVSAAKVLVMTSARLVGAHAVQLHGGIGVTEEHLISHYFRRLTAFAIRFGGADYHLSRFVTSQDGL